MMVSFRNNCFTLYSSYFLNKNFRGHGGPCERRELCVGREQSTDCMGVGNFFFFYFSFVFVLVSFSFIVLHEYCSNLATNFLIF